MVAQIRSSGAGNGQQADSLVIEEERPAVDAARDDLELNWRFRFLISGVQFM